MLPRKPHHKQLTRKPMKRGTKQMRKIGKNALGISKREWNNEWKEQMKDVVWCESCGNPDGFGDAKLTQMHATKQRFITTREDCFRAAKVCWGEHKKYDFATGDDPHGEMAKFVDDLIAKRC